MSKRIIIPAYDPFPGPEWEAIFDHAGDVYAVILNVNSGVGEDLDPIYVAMRERLRAAGILCLGYCSTRYGERPIAGVASEINDWFVRYKVDGIFLDEQHSGAEKLPYYKRLRGSIGSALMVTNPGVVPAEEYYAVADVICDAETGQETYLAKVFEYLGRAKQCHIVFSVTDAKKVMEAIDRNRTEYFYLTTAVPAPGASGPEFSIPDTIWPQLSAPTPTPAPNPETGLPPMDATSEESWAVMTLTEVARIMGSSVTLANLPAHAEGIMSEINRLRIEVAGSLRAVTDEQLVGEVLRRLNK